MFICIFDTETTSLDRPFCYNIGYVIVNSDTWEKVLSRSFVVEQVWHNLPLFQSAYYADKRPLYVSMMRCRHTTMDKFGYICQQMRRDFIKYDVKYAYAYNSSFDEKVFNFNCDWYKCINPFDTIPVFDIRGFAHAFLVDDEYKAFCEEHEFFSDTGNYSTTAETVFRYVSRNVGFIEAHTALDDAEIESEILRECVNKGADLETGYTARRSIEREQKKVLRIVAADKSEHFFDYSKIRINKAKTEITLK